MKKAIVLLSGGIDSTTCLAIAKDSNFRVYPLTIDYGQRHRIELERAAIISRYFRIDSHLVITIDLRKIGNSALTDIIEVPKDRSIEEISAHIPATYVPARNTIFLSVALAYAEVIGAYDIFIGVNSLDYSGYPDCRPEFIEAFEKMANVATKAWVTGTKKLKIRAPLLHMKKSEIIRTGYTLGVDFSLTHSCYEPTREGIACGRCDSCILRLKGFQEAEIDDPITYAGN
ncbi:MAG: 7-cyano-7-deazaguanine synthase QueC [Thermodesulfobacteriota bacterium]|nr:7-cyano-7-deazaguanine synthase QueC [Thermodesulfobacteriota bacterium]